MKKVLSYLMAIALIVTSISFVGTDKVSAHQKYTTKGLVIDTSLVPQDSNISVKNEDGKNPEITTKTNVQFTLDTNVDSDWSISGPDDKVTIDSYGVVSVKRGASKATYTVTAKGKNIANDYNTEVSCKIQVRGDEDATEATSVKLNKKLIEAGNEDFVNVSSDLNTLTVTGKISKLGLYEEVEPSYILDKKVTYSVDNSKVATVGESGKSLTTLSPSSGITLKATVGNFVQDIKLVVKDYTINDATVELKCVNVPTLKSNSNRFNIKLNQTLIFEVSSTISHVFNASQTYCMWDIKYGDEELTINPAPTAQIKDFKLATIGKYKGDTSKILVQTPIASSDDYKKLLKENNTIKLHFDQYYTGDGNGNKIIPRDYMLSFSEDVNSFSSVDLDFSSYYEENKDFSVKKEVIEGEERDVYYLESDGTTIDLPQITQSNVPAVRNFEDARESCFYNKDGSDPAYEVSYKIGEVKSLNDSYKNNTMTNSNTELSSIKEVNTEDRTLTKKGTGYFTITVTTKGEVNYTAKTYYIRLVTAVEKLTISHSKQEKEVIHIRQGEADTPTLQIGGVTKNVTDKDPYLDIEFLKADGSQSNIATATVDDSKLTVNGISTGKVTVRVSSAVDKSKTAEYILYVNDEYFKPDMLFIDCSEAIKDGYMDNDGNVQGRVDGANLKVTAQGIGAGVPLVDWISSDESVAKVINGKLYTYKSTGTGFVTIQAVARGNSDVKSEPLTLYVKDIPATGIKTIAEAVKEGRAPVVSEPGNNTGICKAFENFTLEAKDYVPSNASSAPGKITWSSSDSSVATIDANTGLVRTLKEGTTTITARYNSSTTDFSDTTYTLVVKGEAEHVTRVAIENGLELRLAKIGDSDTLKARVDGTVANKNVIWSTSNKNIVTVTDNGVVTAVAAGTAVITATSAFDNTKKATIKVIVPATQEPTTKVKPTKKVKVAKASIKSAKNVKKKALLLKLKRTSSAKKYKIQCALNKKFTKSVKTVTTSKLSYKFKKLKAKKKYYVRVRGINGKVKGPWSSVKKVIIKK